jgi:integrase/recombinase XerD
MKKFSYAVDKYLKLRCQLGFKLEATERLLKKFTDFLETKRAPYITTELTRSFINQNSEASAAQKSAKLATIRQFALYWKGIELRTEIPPPQLFPYIYHRTNPYIYSLHDIKKLMWSCNKLGQREPIIRHTYFNLFGLLAVSGMRINEALSLTCDSVDLKNGLIIITKSKFSKSRIVPIHSTTQDALKKYVNTKIKLSLASRSNFFLFLLQGSSLNIGMCVRHSDVS